MWEIVSEEEIAESVPRFDFLIVYIYAYGVIQSLGDAELIFTNRKVCFCMACVALLLCATFVVAVDGDDDLLKMTSAVHDGEDERSFGGLVMSSAGSPMPTGNGDFSELVSHGNNESNWFPSIAIDSDGNLHVVWYELDINDGFKSNILYRMKSGDSWMPIEVISADNARDNTWFFANFAKPSIALDSFGNVHVAWESDKNQSDSGTDQDIFYKVRTQGEWTATELVSTESDESSSLPSIAVDHDGNVHIAWTDASDIPGTEDNVSVFYKMKTALGWTSTRVIQSEADSICKNANVIVGSNGDVHISWIEITGEDYVHHIKHRMKADGHWGEVETVRQSNIEIGDWNGLGMALESTGLLHLIWSEHDYQNNLNDPFTHNYHSVKDDGVWSTPEMIPVGTYDSDPALSIDKDNRLHVVMAAYPLDYDSEIQSEPETINIGYITYHDGSWSEYGFVDLDRIEAKMMMSIDVDSDRNVHVAWIDALPIGGLSMDLRYAMIDNSELYTTSPEGETSVGVFVVFIAGLFVISMIVMRMRR